MGAIGVNIAESYVAAHKKRLTESPWTRIVQCNKGEDLGRPDLIGSTAVMHLINSRLSGKQVQ